MKTDIAQDILDTPAGDEANRILRNCVHCGFCNATCPTYQLTGDELDGPRGRIYLIKQMLEGEQPGEHTQLHLDRCLTCRNCETTCPSGVEYGKLLDTGRLLVNERVPRSLLQRVSRTLLRKLLLSPRLFTLSLRSGQLLRSMLPASMSKKIPQRARKTLQWPSADHERKILLVSGCVQDAMQPDIDPAAAQVLDRIGIQVISAPGAGCCGAISHHLGAEREALRYIKNNIDAWWPYVANNSIEAICMTASGCGLMIKDYGHVLAHDPAYAEKAAAISALYREPAELIAGYINDHKQSPFSTGNQARRIAFHPPCTLQHGLKLNGTIESILAVAGYELVPFAEPHLCCGSAGTYSITQKKLSQALLARKTRALEAAGPALIATANIGCHMHLQSGTAVPVRHWLQLLTTVNNE